MRDNNTAEQRWQKYTDTDNCVKKTLVFMGAKVKKYKH